LAVERSEPLSVRWLPNTNAENSGQDSFVSRFGLPASIVASSRGSGTGPALRPDTSENTVAFCVMRGNSDDPQMAVVVNDAALDQHVLEAPHPPLDPLHASARCCGPLARPRRRLLDALTKRCPCATRSARCIPLAVTRTRASQRREIRRRESVAGAHGYNASWICPLQNARARNCALHFASLSVAGSSANASQPSARRRAASASAAAAVLCAERWPPVAWYFFLTRTMTT